MKYLKLYEQFINERKDFGGKPNLSIEDTKLIALKVADKIAKKDNAEVTVNMGTLESDSFDLDYNGIEYDGGSYCIYDNGDVVNHAISEQPVVYNWKKEK